MIKKTLILILIIFILIHKHYFYHLVISNIRLTYWLLKQDTKKILQDKKLTRELGIENFFLNQKLGISELNAPYFDKQILFRENNILGLLDFNKFGKTDSLPHMTNFFTTPFNLFGKWIGDSVFRIDLELRGDNNLLKEKYLSGLSKKRVDYYQKIFREHISKILQNKKHNLLDVCTKLCTDLLYITHLGKIPSKQEYEDINIFIDAVANFSLGVLVQKKVRKQLFNLKFFYHQTIKQIRNLDKKKICIINDWLNAGINENDCFIEYIHNLIGMVVNWINTIHPYLIEYSKKNIPAIEKGLEKEYLFECFRYLMPVKFVASKIKNEDGYNNSIHDLTLSSKRKEWGPNTNKFDIKRMKNYEKYMTKYKNKCPFYNSNQNAKIPCHMSILERDIYTPFGIGYRRCPGELISMAFLEEVSWFVKNKNIKIYLKNGISKKENYIFDKRETNFIIEIKKLII